MIIADDERLIRESLHQLMDWSRIGVEVVGTAADGLSALQMVENLKADILLSDIAMPKLTGVELIKKVREKQLKCEIVFLSAYSNFEYAQSAIRYGAFDYILKPIDEDKLLLSVSNCAEKIMAAKEKENLSAEDALQSVLVTSAIKNLLYTSLLPTAKEAEILRSLQIDLASKSIVSGICLRLSDPSSNPIDFLSHLDVVAGIKQFSVQISREEYIIIGIAHENFTKALERHMGTAMNQIRQRFNTQLTNSSISGIQPIVDIKRIYPECCLVFLGNKMGYTNPDQRYADTLSQFPDVSFHPDAADFATAMSSNQSDTVVQLLNGFFADFAKINQIFDINNVKLECMKLLDDVVETLHFSELKRNQMIKDFLANIKMEITTKHSLDMLYDVFREALITLCETYQDDDIQSTWLVSQAIKYIQESYTTATLTLAAKKLYITPSYLSRIFAQEMQETFSHYLLIYRMQSAKKMLADPKYKIYDVSNAVGYTNVSNFSKAFKHITGETPKEYRNNIG